jgi:hypothetical protein
MPFARGMHYPLHVRRLSDTQSRTTIGLYLLEEGSVNHNRAVDGFLNRLPVLHVKGRAMAAPMVSAPQRNELSTALNKVSPGLFFVSMILKGKSLKSTNALRPMEFRNFELDRGFAKLSIVKV